jgi:glycerol transport system ATP-binding protein
MHLTLQNVTKVVNGQTHLYGIDLEFASGSFNVLLGPTRAGKTSVMRLMAGLDHPSSGKVIVDGKDVTCVSVRERNVAMVYQQFVNYPSFTVYANIASPLRLAKCFSAKEIDAKVRATAEMLHIEHLLDRLPAELSGGQQQRTAMARGLVKGASLLLLDEPLVNLDYKLREELRSEMRQIFGQGNTTVVYATTEPQEALMLGGNTAVLDAGRLLQTGPALEVYHRPATVRTSEVFSNPPINLIRASIGAQGCRLSADVAFPRAEHMRSLPPGDYQVGVRANHIDVVARAESGGVIPATVELAEISGSETFLHVRNEQFVLVLHLPGVHEYDVDTPILIYIPTHKLFVFEANGRLIQAPSRRLARTA